MKDNITEDPVKLNSDSDYGLASSGLLVAAGMNGLKAWMMQTTVSDLIIPWRQRKWHIFFFGVRCAMKPSNKGITILVAASNEEVEEQLNELFKYQF